MKLYTFFRYNKHKKLSLRVFFLSAYYRACILVIPQQLLQKYMGTPGKESSKEVDVQVYAQLRSVSYIVNRICNQTPWESKCLVRALTAQRILYKKRIVSTLYLGVGKEKEEMIAHAWLRCGEYYVTGGNGNEFAVVAKFLK